MCGIAGIVRPDGVEARDVRGMLDLMHHRGPDEQGLRTEPGVAIGTARLSIIDLEGGAQPIPGEDEQTWVVLNGEIYNFPELRVELQALGHKFRTRTDTEVVVHAYEEWGVAGIGRLKGMFGLAVLDLAQRRVVLARDPAGEKPLFYVARTGLFAFASEMKPLLPLRGDDSLSTLALQSYFAYSRPAGPLSAFDGIKKLPPGGVLEVGLDATPMRESVSWAPPTEKHAWSVPDAERRLHTVLREAVGRCLVADVPVGALLSGGVDSALVVALAQEQSSQPLQTFTIVYDDPHMSEGPAARAIAAQLGTDHHEVEVSAHDILSVLPRLIWHFEEPFADASAVPAYFVTAFAREHVKVALTGDGGDELFGGYDWYRAWRVTDALRRLPAPLRRAIGLARHLPAGVGARWPAAYHYANAIRRTAAAAAVEPPVERFLVLAGGTDQGRIIGDEALARLVELRTSSAGAYAAENGLDEVMFFQFRGLLPELFFTKLDRMSMMSSLECRSPLVYRDVVDFALGLPVDLKVRRTTTKFLLKQVLGRYLPRPMIHRPKKGFSIPLYRWLREDPGLRAAVERYTSGDRLDRLAEVAHVDPLAIAGATSGYLGGQNNDWTIAWRALCFGLWVEMFVARDGSAPLEHATEA